MTTLSDRVVARIDGVRVETSRERLADMTCTYCGGSGRWPHVPQAECPKCNIDPRVDGDDE